MRRAGIGAGRAVLDRPFARTVTVCLLAICVPASVDARQPGDTTPARGNGRELDVSFDAGKDKPPLVVHVRLRPREEAAAILRTFRYPELDYHDPVLARCDAGPEAVAKAVALAGMAIADLNTPPDISAEATQEEKNKLWARRQITRRMIKGILGAAGDPVALMDRPVHQDVKFNEWHAVERLFDGAMAEDHRGSLRSGLVQAKLADPDPAWRLGAAAALSDRGFINGRSVTVEDVRDREDCLTHSAWDLLLYDGPDAADAARRSLARLRARTGDKAYRFEMPYAGNMSVPLVAFLAVHGGDEDGRVIESLRLGSAHARLLALLTEDPAPLMSGAVAGGFVPDDVVAMLSTAAALPEDRATECFEEMLAIAVGHWAESNAGRKNADSPALLEAKLRVRCTGFMPHQATAKLFYQGHLDPGKDSNDAMLGSVPWVCAPHMLNQVLERLERGDNQLFDQLWYVPIGKLKAALAEHTAAFERPDLALAYFECFAPALMGPADWAAPREMRRAYMLRHFEGEEGKAVYGGAISGVLLVRPEVVDSTLRLRVQLRQEACYLGGSLVDFKEGKASNYEHHAYIADGGRRLLKAVRAQRCGQPLTVIARPREDGWFVFEAALDEPELEGVSVQIDLGFFETTIPVAFDIAASGLGREWRRAEMLAGQARGRMQSENSGESILALAEARVATGQITEAAGLLRGIATQKRDLTTWLRITEMLSAAGLHEAAAGAWKDAIAAGVAPATANFDMASELFKARKFREAAAAFAIVVAADKSDAEASYFLAMSLFLAGEREAAVAALGGIPDTQTGPVVMALRLLLAEKGEAVTTLTKKLGEVARAEESDQRTRSTLGPLLGIQAPPRIDDSEIDGNERCRIACFEGYRYLLAGRAAEAKKQFAVAVDAGELHQIERVMAEVELARLPDIKPGR